MLTGILSVRGGRGVGGSRQGTGTLLCSAGRRLLVATVAAAAAMVTTAVTVVINAGLVARDTLIYPLSIVLLQIGLRTLPWDQQTCSLMCKMYFKTPQ